MNEAVAPRASEGGSPILDDLVAHRITSYNVCYTKLLRGRHARRRRDLGKGEGLGQMRLDELDALILTFLPDDLGTGVALVITSYSIHYTKLYEEAAMIGNLVASITVQQLSTTGVATIEQVRSRWQEANPNRDA